MRKRCMYHHQTPRAQGLGLRKRVEAPEAATRKGNSFQAVALLRNP